MQRAEVIVIAKIIPSSIVWVTPQEEKGIQVHRAKLGIMQTLKGKTVGNVIDVIILHGLTPVRERFLNKPGSYLNDRHSQPTVKAGAIAMYDTGEMGIRFSEDLREPHIWLLSRSHPGYERPQPIQRLGLWDPNGLKGIEKKDILLKFIK